VVEGLSALTSFHVMASWWNQNGIVHFEWNGCSTRWYFPYYLGRSMPLMSLLGSVSLFFSGKSRRGEISYFVFVRACRSAYIYLKKRHKFPISS
jgi:hypothetical protein